MSATEDNNQEDNDDGLKSRAVIMESSTQTYCIKRKRKGDELMKQEQDKETLLALLGFGTILKQFPEFLEFVVPFIADRTVSNAVVGSSKAIYNTIKADLTFKPPWPKNYKLDIPTGICTVHNTLYNLVFCPDGIQIACIVVYNREERILIFHQRYGRIRFYRHAENNNNNNNDNDDDNELGWIPYRQRNLIPDLKYSPDGRFLVSNNKTFVTLWEYNVTINGNVYYEQLQEWNIKQEINGIPRDHIDIDVSPCSRYIVVLSKPGNVLLKDVQKNGETIKSVLLPDHEYGHHIKFSNGIDGHHSIFIYSYHGENIGSIKIWHPFDGDNGSLITILENSSSDFYAFCLSHDNSMIGINERNKNNAVKGMVYSLDNNGLATFKQSFSAYDFITAPIQFTPDDKFITYTHNESKQLLFRDIISCRDIADPINITCNGVRVERDSIVVINFSPVGNYGSSGWRVLVRVKKKNGNSDEYYIASFFG